MDWGLLKSGDFYTLLAAIGGATAAVWSAIVAHRSLKLAESSAEASKGASEAARQAIEIERLRRIEDRTAILDVVSGSAVSQRIFFGGSYSESIFLQLRNIGFGTAFNIGSEFTFDERDIPEPPSLANPPVAEKGQTLEVGIIPVGGMQYGGRRTGVARITYHDDLSSHLLEVHFYYTLEKSMRRPIQVRMLNLDQEERPIRVVLIRPEKIDETYLEE